MGLPKQLERIAAASPWGIGRPEKSGSRGVGFIREPAKADTRQRTSGGSPPAEGRPIRSRTPDERDLKDELDRAERALGQAGREIESLRERLAAEIAEREELLTVVSHELRTPLTVIAGFNRLLLSERVGHLTPEQRRFLEESNRSCAKLDAFIESLIEAARQLGRDGPVELYEASLDGTVRSVTEFLRPLLEERGVKIELSLDPAAARARFHPMRIEQVLTNLIANAARFAARRRPIEVATRALPGTDQIEIAVSDDGPGVHPDERERIFRPWVRGEGQDAAGLGLGLSICKRIVEAHHGAISVGDAPGGGSRFAFTLLAPSAAARAEVPR